MDLKTSASEKFQRNTKNELREFCREAGIKVGPNAGEEYMRKQLLTKYGIGEGGTDEMRRDSVVRYRARNQVTPEYNLTPNGTWEGRRIRIRLARPFDATKGQKGELFSWNGKNPYRVPYNEIEAVPEPIFNIIREKTRPVAVQVKNEATGEQTTDFVFEPRFAMDNLGVDPDTQNRCGSLTEWYQDKGPKWLRERTLPELVMIAEICQIERNIYRTADGMARAMTRDELLPKLMIAFFSYPDVGEDDDEPVPESGKKKAATA